MSFSDQYFYSRSNILASDPESIKHVTTCFIRDNLGEYWSVILRRHFFSFSRHNILGELEIPLDIIACEYQASIHSVVRKAHLKRDIGKFVPAQSQCRRFHGSDTIFSSSSSPTWTYVFVSYVGTIEKALLR